MPPTTGNGPVGPEEGAGAVSVGELTTGGFCEGVNILGSIRCSRITARSCTSAGFPSGFCVSGAVGVGAAGSSANTNDELPKPITNAIAEERIIPMYASCLVI
jgi:hypothetical protein